MKKKTRLEELNETAESVGLYVCTYSPGDGVTRYRFFEVKESGMKEGTRVRVKAHTSGPGKGLSYPPFTATLLEYCNGEGWDVIEVRSERGDDISVYSFDVSPLKPAGKGRSNYFGPENGIYTALGYKEACVFLAGKGAWI